MEKNDQIEIKDEDIQETDFTPEEIADDTIDWKAKAQELKGIAKRRATQLSKAKDKLKSLSEAKIEAQPQPKETQINKPNEPDYARLAETAYLKSEGISHLDDIKIVKDEAERLKLPINEVIGMEHIQSKLEANKTARTAQAGMPKGNKRSGAVTPDEVEYYLQNPDKRPDDFEVAKKVLAAKRKLSQDSNKFSDIMYDE